MSVITVSRQLGSMGRDVAVLVAQRMGYRFVWRDMINEAARRASTPQVALATIDELDILGIQPNAKDRKAYCAAISQIMNELADADNVVILGRAGQVVLADHPYALHVRIVAPVAIRIERIVRQMQVTPEAALLQVDASDQHRRDYLRRFYKQDWDDPALYDLTINTAHLSTSAVADIIWMTVATHHAPVPSDIGKGNLLSE